MHCMSKLMLLFQINYLFYLVIRKHTALKCNYILINILGIKSPAAACYAVLQSTFYLSLTWR